MQRETKQFNETDSDFYDLEYFISLEYRYFSGAHNSRIKNIFSYLKDLKGKRCLDIGCGGGFFVNDMSQKGALVTGIDYSRAGIIFAKERFPQLDFRIGSVYNLDVFEPNTFDVITLLDVIEHISDKNKALSEIKRVLKPEGLLIITTDIKDGIWDKWKMPGIIRRTQYFSKDGRAYLMIKKVESFRRQFKNYNNSHIGLMSYQDIKNFIEKNNFQVIEHKIYPLVGVPMRDFFLKFLPEQFRGDHQCIMAISDR